MLIIVISNHWSGDNASNKITCSLWDTLCILKSLSLNFEFFFWTKSKSRFRTFFWLSVGVSEENKVIFFGEKLSPGVFGLGLLFFQKYIIFCFSKRCSEAWEQYFWDFWFAPRKISRRKDLFVFSTTDVFVPVSQLSTRDLFYFLENLKIKQDISVLCFSSRLIIRSTSVMIPLFQIIFWNKNVQESVNFLSIRGILQSQLWCRSWIFDTSPFRKMFELLTCKRNHNLPCREFFF
jgi:hypothetical protein